MCCALGTFTDIVYSKAWSHHGAGDSRGLLPPHPTPRIAEETEAQGAEVT